MPSPGLYGAKIKGNKLLALQSLISISASSIPDDTSSFTGDLSKSYREFGMKESFVSDFFFFPL